MAYPKTLYKIVNSLDEEKAAVDFGCTVESDGTTPQPYPKMLYLHPSDPSKEHKPFVVNSDDEKNDMLGKGYQEKPHIPVVVDEFEPAV